jgi:hypothetical protein
MNKTASAIGSAIWHNRMAHPYGSPRWVRDGTNERTNVRTQQTNASKTRANHLTFLNARVGLWITRISRGQAVAS